VIKKYYHLLAILAVFIIPMIISTYLYKHHADFHFKTTNYGQLIQPPIYFRKFWPQYESQQKWCLIYISRNQEVAFDSQKLFILNQLKKALGKDSQRLKLLFISNQLNTIPLYDFQKFWLNEKNLQALTTDLKMPAENKIFILDPLSNMMMSYASKEDPMHILKDMKKLLQVSQMG
jgi:disulfide bond formation protein DsbB